jgi:hypothetical protein
VLVAIALHQSLKPNLPIFPNPEITAKRYKKSPTIRGFF